MMYSTPFMYGYMTLNNSDSERENLLLPLHKLLFLISSTACFNAQTGQNKAFVTPVVHWLEQEIAPWVHYERSIQRPIVSQEDALPQSCISLPANKTKSGSYRELTPSPSRAWLIKLKVDLTEN